MTSLDERGAEALQELVTPATFEGIATQLEEAQREKQRIIDQRVRISQGKSSARIAGQPELVSGARVDATELSRKAQKKYLNMVHTKYLERKTQNPKKSDSGNPGNQTKRLNSLHDKHVQVSLNNHCHSIVFYLCENTKQFSCSVKAYGQLAHTFLQSCCGQVLVGSFFDYCDNVQDERVSLGKHYPYNGYECAGNTEPATDPPIFTPPPEEQSMNVEESETEQNDGLSIQNRKLPSDGDDSQLDTSFQDEGQPSVSHSVSSIQNKTQQEKVPSNPDTIRDIPQPLSSSPVKRPNPKRVQLAGVGKRARTSTSSEFQATQVVIDGCRSNAPKASEPRSVASIVDQGVRRVIKVKKGTNVNTIRKRSYASKDEKHKRKAIRRPDSYVNFLKGTSDQAKTTNLPPPCTPALRCDHSSRELTDCEYPIQLVQPSVSSQLQQTSNVIEHIIEPELLAVLQEYEEKLRTAQKRDS